MTDIWPFVPQRGVTERMEWSTSVIRCRSAEQRMALRNIPRTSVEYSYQLVSQEIEAATYLARQLGADSFLVPLWPEYDEIGTIASGTTNLTVDTTTKRYKASGYCFVFESNTAYEITTIDTVNAGSLDLTGFGVLNTYTNAIIMPCYTMRFKSPFTIEKRAFTYLTARAEFILADDFGISSSNPFTSFNSSYVLSDRPVILGSVQETNKREFSIFPNVAGPIYYSEDYTYPISTMLATWSFNTDSEAWAFREWMYGVKGKQQSFYMPRWTRDFEVGVNISSADTLILFDRNLTLVDNYLGAICIVETDGTQTYAIITSWAPYSPSYRKANLSTSVGADINISDIELVCRMPKVRFNSDVIEFAYKDAGVVDIRLPVMEVPE